MVSVRRVPDGDFDAVHSLHNRFTDQSVPHETVRSWYDETPGLFVAAYDDDLVGICTGHRRGDDRAELAGLGVLPERRREGIGTRLVEQFEANAAAAGFEHVSLGSAGGYVDNFYAGLGYEPESVLVRLDGDVPVPQPAEFDVCRERIEDGTRKLYLEADVVDHEYLDAVREAFGDDEAIYIVRKSLDGV